jgi:hypothetical protein
LASSASGSRTFLPRGRELYVQLDPAGLCGGPMLGSGGLGLITSSFFVPQVNAWCRRSQSDGFAHEQYCARSSPSAVVLENLKVAFNSLSPIVPTWFDPKISFQKQYDGFDCNSS